MTQGFQQDFQVISNTLRQAPEQALDELGGDEARVAKMAAAGHSMDEVCKALNMQPDQVWAMISEALDRLQGTRWEQNSGDIRPLDAEEIQRPVQGI